MVSLLADEIVEYDVEKSEQFADAFFLIHKELDKTTRKLIDEDIWLLNEKELTKLRDDITKVLGK